MKVLNLQCAAQHSFEGWFASEDDFQAQLMRGLIECPMCSEKSIYKMPSAPRLNFGAQQMPRLAAGNEEQPTSSPSDGAVAPAQGDRGAASKETAVVLRKAPGAAEQAAFLIALRNVMATTEDVGERFADEARSMHYGDTKARSIRGQASARETVELLEEGIEVMPLPLPAALKETLQ